MSRRTPEPRIVSERVEAPYMLGSETEFYVDVVVIGSGAGGSTVASHLAEQGFRTLILEEGKYYTTAENSGDVIGMMGQLMRDGGTTAIMGKSPINYMEGRCLGGTTVLNGGMCWRTPEEVMSEWRTERKLTGLSSAVMDEIFSEVEETIDARHQDSGSQGGANLAFKKGADALGWHLSHNKRNQEHCVGANDCVTGCPSGAKRSTVFTWLPKFLEAGGRLITGMKVEHLMKKNGRVVGVQGLIDNPYRPKRFTVHARAVVLACGAIQTPLLMQRSGLHRGNPHVGKHFTIHPNVKVAARFDEPVDSMRGTHQAWQCTEFVDEGILLAPGSIPFAFMSLIFPSFGPGLNQSLKDWKYVATGGVLVDDSSSGFIKRGPFGVPNIHYDVTDVDQVKFIKAASKLAELYFAAGANEVYTAFHECPVLRSPDDLSLLHKHPPRIEATEYFTAHLMGTCRMDGRSGHGVVDENGQCTHIENLFIADASVLPGTIGVNPQVTIMALALFIGRRMTDMVTKSREV